MEDYGAYPPAGRPVSFVAGPVYDRAADGTDLLLGVIVLEMPTRAIDALLQTSRGFGARGEAVLIGRDGRLRSTSRFPDGGGLLSARFVNPALPPPTEGGSVSETTVRGQAMIVASAALKPASLGWAVVTAEDADELLQPVRDMVARIGLICLAVTLALAAVAVAIAARIARPVLSLVERFDAALSNMPHGLVMVDTRRRIILCNTAYREMYALPPPLTETGTPLDAIDSHRRDLGMAPIEPQSGSAVAEERRELLDGRTIDITRNTLPSGGYVATHQNITAAIRAQKQIAFLATHDALTALPNRASFGERIAEGLRRVSSGEMLAVLCLDLDYFKAVNDTLGHPMGDRLLKAVAARLTHELRRGDILARVGGDEFVVLQTELSSPEEAPSPRPAADRAHRRAVRPRRRSGHHRPQRRHRRRADRRHRCGYPPQERGPRPLQGQGRRPPAWRISSSPAWMPPCRARRQLELDLRDALASEAFHLNYQPQYSIHDQRMTGVEALLRWTHPTRGPISPAEFIPLAEERGPDRADRRVGAAPRLRRCRQMAVGHPDRRQPFADADQVAGADRDRPGHPDRDGAAAAAPRARDHRVGAVERRREYPRHAARAEAPGPAHRHGRFRHRLLLAQLPAVPSPSTRSRSTSPSFASSAGAGTPSPSSRPSPTSARPSA